MITAAQIKQVFNLQAGQGHSTLEESVDVFIYWEIVIKSAPKYSNTFISEKNSPSILPHNITFTYKGKDESDKQYAERLDDYKIAIAQHSVKNRDTLVEELRKRGFTCYVIHYSDDKWSVRIDW